MVQVNVLKKPIEHIRENCELAGIADRFDRARPEIERFLEAEVARGEARETRLTFHGLCHLRQLLLASRDADQARCVTHLSARS